MDMLVQRIRAAVDGVDPDFRQKVVAEGAQAGLWDLWQGLEALQALYPARPVRRQLTAADLVAKAERRHRRPPLTRRRRWDERPQAPSGRFVRAVSLDPVLDWTLGDGPLRTLQLVLSLAGGVGRPLVTLSCSIARAIGRTTRTVQNHWRALVDAGWIMRSFDRRTGLVTITVTEAARTPESRSENPAPWPQEPQPKAINAPGWWHRLKARREREARRAVIAEPGAKFPAHIKTPQNLKPESVRAPAPIFANRNVVAAGGDSLLSKRVRQMASRAHHEAQERFGRPVSGIG